MKNLTVGKRIILGFASLILIAVILGVVAIVQMSNVEKGSRELAEAYVPEVEVSNNIERNLMMGMYAFRGYQFTENESFNQEGQGFLSQALDFIDAAAMLGQEKNLPGLQKEAPILRRGVEQYESAARQTAVKIGELKTVRERMDSNAGSFVAALNALLEQNEQAVEQMVEERTFKVTTTEEVLMHGNNARILNMRAQASREEALFDEALEELDLARAQLESLRPVTRDAEDIKLLDESAQALEIYAESVSAFTDETAQGEAARAAVLDRLQGDMDAAAASFTDRMKTMFAGQVEKMKANVDEGIAMIGWVNDVIDLGNAARVNNFRAQALGDPSYTDEAIGNIEAMDPIYRELEARADNAENRAGITEAKQASTGYKKAMEDYVGIFRTLADLNQTRIDVGSEALESAKELAALGIEETTAISDQAVTNLAAANKLMIVGLLIAAVVGIFLAIVITKSIIGPLTQAIADLTSGSSESTSAAEQVSSASQSLAEGASEQASSLEETSSSMEEITSMVAHNADVAKQTSEHAQQASSAAEDGVRSMSELRSGADSVNESAKEMEEAMNAIKESSDSISKIIKTIDEIAFQTNILALNAAVEAARAGEAGAGFAVVADEVRSLAHRAAEAAQETATLIEGSMERSERGVRVNETVGKNLVAVLEKAETVENGLQIIRDTVGEVSSSMQGLEASVVEQQEGINQINTAVTQVNDVTQTNAASAEEAASAAEEMNAQAVSLMEIVGTLTLMVTGKKVDSVHTSSHGGGAANSGNNGRFSLPGD
jgi:methyl-accepting chemotaxis protein